MKNILIHVTGSIACFKAGTLVSLLTKKGYQVQATASAGGLRFIQPVLLEQPPCGQQKRRRADKIKQRSLQALASQQIRAHPHSNTAILWPYLKFEPYLQTHHLHQLPALAQIQFPDLAGQAMFLHGKPAVPERLDECRNGFAQIRKINFNESGGVGKCHI